MLGVVVHILLHRSLFDATLEGLIQAANDPVHLGVLGTFEAWAVIVASLVTVLAGVFASFMVIHRALNRIEGTAKKELEHNGGRSTKDLAKQAKEAAEQAQLEAANARASAALAQESIEEIRRDMKRLFELVRPAEESHESR